MSQDSMGDYFFPTMFIVPDFEPMSVDESIFSFAKRRWETTTFDLATLATRHKLHLPYQVMDVFLSRCNSEICVRQQSSLEDASQLLKSLKLSLFAAGISPFVTPFVTTYSINEYSGINSRDSDALRSKLPVDMQIGITSDSTTVEAWPVELSFQCVVLPDSLQLTAADFASACSSAARWSSMLASNNSLRGFSDAMIASVTMASLNQSILHLWCAMESLFPSVAAELSFRMSLYLAQLNSNNVNRLPYFHKVKKGYNIRSRIAHGAKHESSLEEWRATWEIATDTFNSIVRRGELPGEDDLLAELLTHAGEE